MKKYFYSDGTDKFGPFSLEELREKKISRETKVWFQELGDWKPAGTIPELTELFTLAPSPITKSNFNNMENSNNQRPPKTWLVESILVTLFCCLPLGIAGIVNAAKVESCHYAGDIKGANRASADAKKWTMISFWSGIVFLVLYFIFVFALAAIGNL
jgi:hypothetical protein